MSNSSDSNILVGVFTAPHGVRGLVKLQSFTEIPDEIENYCPLQDASGKHNFSFSIKGEAKGQFIVAVDGVNTREAAEKISKTKLFIARERLPKITEENSFFVNDLIGLSVELADGSAYGEVKAVYNFGAGDILEITPSKGGKDEMILFSQAAFPDIDLASKKLVYAPLEKIIVAEN